ncbi:MAG: MBL fold metallo-hydrolase, partial [Treponemataceae bacterium]|nr:MBL fold metallo-hydrolase [Treponemataceae bacterium]
MSNLRLTVLGSGTSHGIPVIACDCKVCKSSNPKDKRYRASVYVELESDVPLKDGDFPTSFVIDVGPEFRLQCIEHKIKHLDAVLITHGHADHLNGLDDIRIFSHTQGCTAKADNEPAPNPIEIYANTAAENDIKRRFDYVYKNTQEGGGKPRFDVVNTDKTGASFEIPGKSGTIYCTAVPIMHGNLPVNGYLLQTERGRMDNAIAYITDCNFIPESSFDLIKGVN